ncbi:MAG: hypothetical protein ACI9IA_000672 [Enterobacterales bacterium]|jgi:hypothetical protein
MKTLVFITIFLLTGCLPSSYIGNIPSGIGGSAMSQYGDTPPTSFAYPLKNGYYFISMNEYNDIIILTVRLSKNAQVKLLSNIAMIGSAETNLKQIKFPALEYSPATNSDCGFTKYIGCNNFYTFSTSYKLEKDLDVIFPTMLGQRLIFIAPKIIIDGVTIETNVIEFLRKEDVYLSPLNS